MKKIIEAKLLEIEKRENVKIIYAAESGSRAWGFASADSDYDVRFIYIRKREDYLKLNSPRDVIEWQLDDTLDISGWDLQKALRLLYKSNPTIFEWAGSPTVYRNAPEWDDVCESFSVYFKPKLTFYHYLSMAKGNRPPSGGENVKLKKYLYTLRPILACRHILETGTPPPMPFAELCSEYLDTGVYQHVKKLLKLKLEGNELSEGLRIYEIDEYINSSFAYLDSQMSGAKDEASSSWDMLNRLFLRLTV